MTRHCVKNATIVSVDPEIGVLDRGDILVEDGRIVAVGPSVDDEGAETIDASGMIVIPGLVNAHMHIWQTLVRGLGVNWTGVEFHLHVQTDFAPRLSPDDLLRSEYLGAMTLIDGGVTSGLEWCHGATTPEHADAALDGFSSSGIRGVFVLGTVKTLPKSPDEPHFSTIPYPRAEALRMRDRFGANDGRVRFGLGLLGPDYSAIDVVRQDFALAKELDVLSSAHVSGNPGKTPEGYRIIAREGLLTAKHNVVHACAMQDDELRVVLDHGASTTATAAVETDGGTRVPLLRRIVELGGHPSIGTDSEEQIPSDMLKAMRDSLHAQRLFDGLGREAAKAKLGAEGKPSPASTNVVRRGMEIPPRKTPSSYDALHWATIGGARALGIDDVAGSITVGKAADLVFLRKHDVNLAPALNPIDAVVGLAHPGNVDSVMIEGEFVKRNGVLRDAAKVGRVAEDLAVRGSRLLADTGLERLRDSAYGGVR